MLSAFNCDLTYHKSLIDVLVYVHPKKNAKPFCLTPGLSSLSNSVAANLKKLITYKKEPCISLTSLYFVRLILGWQMNNRVGWTSPNKVGEINKAGFALRGGKPCLQRTKNSRHVWWFNSVSYMLSQNLKFESNLSKQYYAASRSYV